MNPLLEKLGVPPEVQAFFNTGEELIFDYGDGYEYFSDGFHKVPASTGLWVAGDNPAAPEMMLCRSVMEAIAWLTFHHYHYNQLEYPVFVSFGILPQANQIQRLKADLLNKKFNLVFGNDLCGRLCDIRVAAALKNKYPRFHYAASAIAIHHEDKIYTLGPGKLSLHAFEKATGLRSGARTSKPKKHNTFLDQLLNP